jgi:cytochrome P450
LLKKKKFEQRILRQAAAFAKDPASFCFDKNNADEKPQTIFQVLHESDLPSSDKQVERVSQEGAEMFAAAGTTARVMTTAMFYLHDNQSILKKLRQELDQAFPDPNMIPSVKILENLSYMVRSLCYTVAIQIVYYETNFLQAAVIKESLRMAAPVATRLPLILREPIKFREWVIPAGVRAL